MTLLSSPKPEAEHLPPKSHGCTHLGAPPSLNQSHPLTRLSHCKARPCGVHNIPPAPARSVTGSGSYVNVPLLPQTFLVESSGYDSCSICVVADEYQ
jgi:hypothetical protein